MCYSSAATFVSFLARLPSLTHRALELPHILSVTPFADVHRHHSPFVLVPFPCALCSVHCALYNPEVPTTALIYVFVTRSTLCPSWSHSLQCIVPLLFCTSQCCSTVPSNVHPSRAIPTGGASCLSASLPLCPDLLPIVVPVAASQVLPPSPSAPPQFPRLAPVTL